MNFDLLYLGFQAEYLIMGELFGCQYEGFKLPADFGFDILVSNQKQKALSPVPPAIKQHPPFVLQVKSRRVWYNALLSGPNARPEAIVDFSVSEKELELLSNEPSSFLVCVLFIRGVPGHSHDKASYFWLDSSHIRHLQQHHFIEKRVDAQYGNKYILDVSFRLLPSLQTEDLLNELIAASHLTEQGKQELKGKLPDLLPTTWSAKEYFSLRKSYLNPADGKASKELPHDLYKLENLGRNISLARVK